MVDSTVGSGVDSVGVGNGRGSDSVVGDGEGVDSSVVGVGEGAVMESLSISLSLPLAKVVDSSIVVVDQRADSRDVDSRGNSLVGNSRGRDSLIGDSRGYSLVGDSRGSNSVAVGDSRGSNSMAVGNSRSSNSVDSSVVSKGECVVEKGISISISLSFPLHHMLDSSILSNVLGAKDTVRDSSVVLRVVVVGDGVSGDLRLGIDHRADSGVVDSRGGDSVVGNSRGCSLVGDSRDSSLVGDSRDCSLDKRGSHLVSVGVEGADEGGGVVGQQLSIGFRLRTGNSGQSENYEHLHVGTWCWLIPCRTAPLVKAAVPAVTYKAAVPTVTYKAAVPAVTYNTVPTPAVYNAAVSRGGDSVV